jgi:hypothetical protein
MPKPTKRKSSCKSQIRNSNGTFGNKKLNKGKEKGNDSSKKLLEMKLKLNI